ncbi:MAG: hypothetical protein FWF46_07105 [Oscillospiraceae bacterium]|nr:hypothetical protein [Oscillospiraceae bacterium]
MYYQDYDNYMKNTTGCGDNPNTRDAMDRNMDQDLERMYPDIYRIVYPMVVIACNNISMPLTEDMLNRMVDDIYDRVQATGRVNMDMNFEDEFRNESRQFPGEFTRERPRRRNRFGRDLIRVLLLRELLDRRRRRP